MYLTWLTTRSTRFKTFPDLLVLHMKKFQLINWMPTKLGALKDLNAEEIS
jgi:uncharacterized UBP type Zn finger protein